MAQPRTRDLFACRNLWRVCAPQARPPLRQAGTGTILLAAGLALIAGCFAAPLNEPDQSNDLPDAVGSAEPVPAAEASPPVLVSIAPPPQETQAVSDLLALWLDQLALDLLSPTGPRLDDSLSFLERLCRAGDDPDFVCRGRYGN